MDIMRQRIEELEKQFSKLHKIVSDHDKKIKGRMGGGPADSSAIDNCLEEIEKLK